MIISRTPFRISFFGGGTDYPVWYEQHSGAALSTTIDKYTYITARYYPPFFPVKYRVVYSRIETANAHDEIEHPSVKATLKHLNLNDGIEIHNSADLPARSGLGSSSSFTVGLLHALSHLLKKPVTKHSLAMDAIHIEQNLIKESVGSQDQVAAAYGGFNKILFEPGNKITVIPIKPPADRLQQLNQRLMLFFTGFSRFAPTVAAEWIKNAPKKQQDLHAMRALVDEAIGILNDPKRDLDDFGRLLHQTWLLKRGLASVISTDFIDQVYAKALSAGAIGGKLLGAGQGGFMVIYADPSKQPAVREALKDLLYVPFQFEDTGTQIIQSGPEISLRTLEVLPDVQEISVPERYIQPAKPRAAGKSVVSIIMPAYNCANLIGRAIDSVLAQSFNDWELIIVNDGSTDGTEAVALRYAAKDPRITVLKNPGNKGVQYTLQKGLESAKGEFIARIDADDAWVTAEKLAAQVSFFKSHPDHVLVGTGAIVRDESGLELLHFLMQETDEQIRSRLLMKNCFMHSSVLFRRAAALKVGGYNQSEEVRHIEDYDLWLKLGTVGKLANLPLYGLFFLSRPESVTAKNRRAQFRRTINLIKKFKTSYPNYGRSLLVAYARAFLYSVYQILPSPLRHAILRRYKQL